MKFKAAAVIFARINGAVFIFAFFAKAKDCVMIESPPKPQMLAVTGNAKKDMPDDDKILIPLVHSKSPIKSPFERFSSLVNKVNRRARGDKILRSKITSVKSENKAIVPPTVKMEMMDE